MLIREIPKDIFTAQLKEAGLLIACGPFNILLGSNLPELFAPLQLLYADYDFLEGQNFVDFDIRVEKSGVSRLWRGARAGLLIDGNPASSVFRRSLALPMLEWGVNWCTFSRPHHLLLLHAAVVEKNGSALILAGQSGSGKSTLSAALSVSGWRLFSDELAILRPGDLKLIPAPRPISLKENSIERIKAYSSQAIFGPAVSGTKKGRVAHMSPPAESLRRVKEKAEPKSLILPRYDPGAKTEIRPVAKGMALLRLIADAFNYNVHGAKAFETVADLVAHCQCYELHYSRLDEAVQLMNEIHGTSN